MKISVIGAAGNVGSAIVFCLAQKKLAREIAMIDMPGDLFEQQYMDMRAVCRLQNVNLLHGRYKMLFNSDIVIIAAAKRLPASQASLSNAHLKANTGLFVSFASAIKKYCPQAAVIQVSSPLEPLAHILCHTADLSPSQILGYTLNDTLQFKQVVRDILMLVKEDELDTLVMGRQGQMQVPVYEHIYVNGRHIKLSNEQYRQISEKYAAVCALQNQLNEANERSMVWSTAMGVRDMVAALTAEEPWPFVCSAMLTGEYGYSNVFCGVPVKLGMGKLQEVTVLNLSNETRAALNTAVESIYQDSTMAMQSIMGM